MSRCSNDYEILRSDCKVLFDKGLSLKKEAKYKEAIIFINKAIELNPKNLKALNYRGLAYCKLHKYKEAIIDFEHALKIETKEKEEYATTCNNKGLALYYYARDYYLTKPTHRKDDDDSSLYEQGRKCLYNDAASYFDKAIEKDPQNIDAWNNKGITMSALGLKEEAIRCFNKAIELNPKNRKHGIT
jgi:tetratricopeptide (TPR) repeat protein